MMRGNRQRKRETATKKMMGGKSSAFGQAVKTFKENIPLRLKKKIEIPQVIHQQRMKFLNVHREARRALYRKQQLNNCSTGDI